MIYSPEMRDYALLLGFEVIDNGTEKHESYRKGNVHIWKTYNGFTWAQLIDGRFTNHHLNMPLQQALEKE